MRGQFIENIRASFAQGPLLPIFKVKITSGAWHAERLGQHREGRCHAGGYRGLAERREQIGRSAAATWSASSLGPRPAGVPTLYSRCRSRSSSSEPAWRGHVRHGWHSCPRDAARHAPTKTTAWRTTQATAGHPAATKTGPSAEGAHATKPATVRRQSWVGRHTTFSRRPSWRSCGMRGAESCVRL